MEVRVLYDEDRLLVTLYRIAHQVVENHPDPSKLYIIGLQPRGILLAKKIHDILNGIYNYSIPYGELDATFFRDDFRRKTTPLLPEQTILGSVEDKNILLVDDVLYTGRTLRAALSAVVTYGRPSKVELLVLIDRRRKREFPIEPNYVGFSVETLDSEKVYVEWAEPHGKDTARIQSNSPQN